MYISLFSDRNEEMELDLREGLDLLANIARKGEKDAHTFVASFNKHKIYLNMFMEHIRLFLDTMEPTTIVLKRRGIGGFEYRLFDEIFLDRNRRSVGLL